jgi:hypothetical protein
MKKHILGLSVLFALTACGGGGSNNNTSPIPSKMLSGTAAAGAAIIGQVTVKGSSGNSISTEIDADGSYSVDVSTLTAPYMLRAEGRVGGKSYTLHSFAEAADVGGTVNITPFTDLIIANAASELASTYFENGNFSSLTTEEIAAQETALQQKLTNVFNALGISSTVDLLRTAFSVDHSGLDAALDIIRIETNTSTSIATITNFIDQQSIEDSIVDPSDNDEVLITSEGLSDAQQDLLAMANKVSALSALFATSLPSVNQLSSLFAEDTLSGDQGKSQLLTDISTDPSLIGLRFSNVTYEDYDQESGTSVVQFILTNKGFTDPEPIRWYMAKNEGTWQFRGDQEIADIYANFLCHYNTAYNTPGCGITIGVDDNDFSNTIGSEGSPIASAKLSVVSNGVVITGSEVYLGFPEDGSAGELKVYDEDFSDDFISFGNAWSQVPAAVFEAGSIIQIELFTEELDVSSAQNPQIALNAMPVQTVTRTVVAEPIANPSVSLFPSASSATVEALSQYSDGDLDVEWSIPTGMAINEIWLSVSQGGDDLTISNRNLSGMTGTNTLTLDTGSLNTSESDFFKELRIYGKNSSGQEFLVSYEYEGVDESSDYSIELTDTVATSVVTDSRCASYNKTAGFEYSFSGTVMTRVGSDDIDTDSSSCITGSTETQTFTMATLTRDFDIPFNCEFYPICSLEDFNKTLTDTSEEQTTTATYTHIPGSNIITYTVNYQPENFNITEVITLGEGVNSNGGFSSLTAGTYSSQSAGDELPTIFVLNEDGTGTWSYGEDETGSITWSLDSNAFLVFVFTDTSETETLSLTLGTVSSGTVSTVFSNEPSADRNWQKIEDLTITVQWTTTITAYTQGDFIEASGASMQCDLYEAYQVGDQETFTQIWTRSGNVITHEDISADEFSESDIFTTTINLNTSTIDFSFDENDVDPTGQVGDIFNFVVNSTGTLSWNDTTERFEGSTHEIRTLSWNIDGQTSVCDESVSHIITITDGNINSFLGL